VAREGVEKKIRVVRKQDRVSVVPTSAIENRNATRSQAALGPEAASGGFRDDSHDALERDPPPKGPRAQDEIEAAEFVPPDRTAKSQGGAREQEGGGPGRLAAETRSNAAEQEDEQDPEGDQNRLERAFPLPARPKGTGHRADPQRKCTPGRGRRHRTAATLSR